LVEVSTQKMGILQPMTLIAAIPFIPESLVAILVAIIGTSTTLLIARWNAKRQDKTEARDDSAVFRGEVLDDNKALRAEVRSLKADITATEKLIAEKSKEIDSLRLLNFKHEQQIIMYEAQLTATRQQTAAQLKAREDIPK
jgi:peptidoglycan hydrolase CwlO-like protein